MSAHVSRSFEAWHANGHRHSGPDVVPERDGSQKMRSADAELLADR